MSNVIDISTMTYLDVPVEKVICGAAKAELEKAIVIGFDKNGDLYFASSTPSSGDILFLMEKAKKMLLESN